MADASRDGNFVPTLLGVSNVDGTTPVRIYADPVTHRLLVSLSGTGGGDVIGPASATDNAIARFDGITGKLIQDSNVVISDTGAITIAGTITLPIVDGSNGQFLQTNGAGALSWATVSGSGTVTSVAFTGGLITVTNPTTAAALTVAGTSGGIPYFSSASTWATSAALAANALVIGGGAGVAPSTITTGTGVVTALGVNVGSAGAVVVNGGALGTPSSGVLTNATGLPITAGTTGTLGVTRGGTGVTAITALSIWVANSVNTITEVTPGAGNSIRVNAGGTAWEAYTPGSGGGDVTKVGTPVNNQVGVWTGDGTIEGDAALTFDTATDTVNTPNVIVSSVAGQAALATFAPGAGGSVITPHLQVLEPSGVSAGIGFARFASATATQSPRFVFARSRGTTIADYTIVQSGDLLGEVSFDGSNGTNFTVGAAIAGFVDGTPGASDMPGRIVFSTTADGATTVTDRIIIDSVGALKPATNDGSALGNTTNQFSDVFLAEGAVINWDNGDATITQTGNVVAVAGADLQVATAGVGTNADSVPTLSSTSTFTNKRITKRTGTTTSSATPTINTDNVDYYSITAQTVDITSMTTNLSGTPTTGQQLRIDITGTAARAITWGASFANGPVALPTTTVTTTRLYVLLEYDGTIWRCMASGSTV